MLLPAAFAFLRIDFVDTFFIKPHFSNFLALLALWRRQTLIFFDSYKLQCFTVRLSQKSFLEDGREVLFDFENKTKDEITNTIQGTLGKTPLVKKREYLEHMQDHNPAEFGSSCKRHCLCEIQGQVSCPSIMPVPLYLESNWRWNHNAT